MLKGWTGRYCSKPTELTMELNNNILEIEMVIGNAAGTIPTLRILCQ